VIVRIELPQVSMNMTEATVVEWTRRPGERFEAGDVLCVFETEKATQEVCAPARGTVVELLVAEESDARVGEVLCVLDVEDET
jgi:pyruvate/2-oxoglutarate dehydrogenase complex dihydrolipoamide acyltransferase (E2) component